MLLKVQPDKVSRIVTDLLSGVVRRTEPYLIDRIISVFTEAQKEGSKLYGKNIRASSACNGCGLCAKACTTGNIKLQGSKPIFAYRCCLCLRCIYSCPMKALEPAIARRFILKNGFSLKELEKELPDFKPIDVNNHQYGTGFAGLKDYFLDL